MSSIPMQTVRAALTHRGVRTRTRRSSFTERLDDVKSHRPWQPEAHAFVLILRAMDVCSKAIYSLCSCKP